MLWLLPQRHLPTHRSATAVVERGLAQFLKPLTMQNETVSCGTLFPSFSLWHNPIRSKHKSPNGVVCGDGVSAVGVGGRNARVFCVVSIDQCNGATLRIVQVNRVPTGQWVSPWWRWLFGHVVPRNRAQQLDRVPRR